MQAGIEVRCPLPPQRPFLVNRGSGYSNPDMRWRWGCSVCPFTCEDRNKDVCQAEADAHKCDYGWCAIPMTEERLMLAAISPFKLPDMTPTKQDRVRWEELRQRNRERRRREQQLQAAADRTRDRVVPLR